MEEYFECLFFGCSTLRKENEMFCDTHKELIADSEKLVICSRCGRVIEAEKQERREVKDGMCGMCKGLFNPKEADNECI